MARSPTKRLLLGLLVVSAVGVLAPTRCEVPQGVYGLTADSRFTRGCFPPLACPLLIGQGIGGTFRVTKATYSTASLYEAYLVTDVYWLTRIGGEDVPIVGSGVYLRGGKAGLMQRLQLDLQVGDEPVQHFDSGLVAIDQVTPGIDVTISIYGEQYFDTVIDVHAIPLPPQPKP